MYDLFFLMQIMDTCQISGALVICCRRKEYFCKIQLFYTRLRRNSVFFSYFSHSVIVIYPKEWAAVWGAFIAEFLMRVGKLKWGDYSVDTH